MKFKQFFGLIAISITSLLFSNVVNLANASDQLKVGVFYYPGWRDNTLSNKSKFPWDYIKPYPERTPLIGYYGEDDDNVMTTQLTQMQQSGIDYVIFDWYWHDKYKVLKPYALQSYRASDQSQSVKFAIMWANHYGYPVTLETFDEMVHQWAVLVSDRRYFQVNDQPVIYIFYLKLLEELATNVGLSIDSYLRLAKDKIYNETGKNVLFYVGASGNSSITKKYLSSTEIDGFFAYNHHGPATFIYSAGNAASHSYDELDAGYRDQWSWFIKNSNKKYAVPTTSGWNDRPWGGSSDPLHDDSYSDTESFRAHIHAAKTFSLTNMSLTSGMVNICCWNEYGEGSYIEPTVLDQGEYLQVVSDVFKE